MKWQFVISSCIAGLGMGILLGAPLNILATERLEKDKGTAVAGLSLARQIGMTIAPTIYAGFIARGFNKIPTLFETDFRDILQENIEKADLSPEAFQELQMVAGQMAQTDGAADVDYTSIMERIQDPTLKEVIQTSVDQITQTAAQSGYDGLFYTTVVIAMLVIVMAIILKPVRNKNLQKQQANS